MSVYNKVVWSEGLFLRPQHFQQQDRYFERYVETRCHALVAHSWGLTHLELERDLLTIGKFGLRRAAGVFPDGTPFRMPDDEPLPSPIDIGAEVHDQVLYLAVPLRRAGSVDVDRATSPDGLVRHDVREVETGDATSSSGEPALLEVAMLRTRFLLASEVTQAYATVPLAQVIESRTDKQVLLDETFIPTVLDVRASRRLSTYMTSCSVCCTSAAMPSAGVWRQQVAGPRRKLRIS
jgi:type VI secretion system protein ImpJ